MLLQDPLDQRDTQKNDSEDADDGGPECGDLGEREIHENHLALDHVEPEVGMDAGQHRTGDEGRGHEVEKFSHPTTCLSAESRETPSDWIRHIQSQIGYAQGA